MDVKPKNVAMVGVDRDGVLKVGSPVYVIAYGEEAEFCRKFNTADFKWVTMNNMVTLRGDWKGYNNG